VTSLPLDGEKFSEVCDNVGRDSNDTILAKVNGVEACCGGGTSGVHESIEKSGEVLTLSVDNQLYAGKSSLLSNYLAHLTAVINTSEIKDRLKPDIIELSRCAINDIDLMHTIEWMRLISLKSIKKIDLRQNLISSVGLDAIAVWLLAIPGEQLRRDYPLEINLKHNLISQTAVRSFVSKIRANPRPEIHLVEDDDEATSVTIFGCKEEVGFETPPPAISSTKGGDDDVKVIFREEPTVIIIKLDLRHNKARSKNQHLEKYRKERKSKIDIISPMKNSSLLDVDLITSGLENSTIYPRDKLMLDHAK